MALSNIFREPRREITESVIGALAILPFCYLDYRLSAWASSFKEGPPFAIGLFLFGAGLIIGGIFIFIALIVTHELGDWICNRLQDAGLHLRPRDRR